MVTRPDEQSAEPDFPGKDPGEEFRFSFRQHWIRMLWPMAKTVSLTMLLVIIGFITFSVVNVDSETGRRLILLFLLLFFLIVQLEFIVRLYRYCLYVIIVTDRRVHRIKKTLLTMDEHECVDLWALQEINKSQRGPIQNLLGFGSLTLEAQDTRMTLHFVPHITKHYGEIMHLLELARKERRRIAG